MNSRTQSILWQIFSISSLLFMVIESQSGADPRYTVTQQGNMVQITSPYGSKVFFADVGFDRMTQYRFEIPIRDLVPQALSGGGTGGAGSGANEGSGKSPVPASGSPEAVGDDDQLILEANRFYNDGKFEESLKFVEELLRRSPGTVRGWVMKGSLLHVLGQKDMARKSWQHALELDPSNQQIQNILNANP